MLSKLLKYDMKTELKSNLPVYLIVLGLSIVVRILDIVKESITFLTPVHAFMLTFCIIGIVGVVLWTLITSIRHFCVNILKDEGYLTNTLPVTRNQIVLSKEITAFLMMILASIIVVLCLLIALLQGSLKDFVVMLMDALDQQGFTTHSFLALLCAAMVLSYMSQVMMAFTALILGHTRTTNKIMYSVVFGIILYMVSQLLGLVILGISYVIAPDITTAAMNSTSVNFADVYDYMMMVIWLSLGATCVMMVAYHCLSVYVANRKLNLE